MKNLIKYFFAVVIGLTSCAPPEHKEVPTKVKMQKINGEWIEETYTLPNNAHFRIDTHRGSYTLRYFVRPEKWYQRYKTGTIRNGIIDYKYSR